MQNNNFLKKKISSFLVFTVTMLLCNISFITFRSDMVNAVDTNVVSGSGATASASSQYSSTYQHQRQLMEQ